MQVKLFFRFLFITFLTITFLVLLGTWLKGYMGSMDTIVSLVGTKKTSQELSAIISQDRFRYIQILLAAFMAAVFLLLWKFNEIYTTVAAYISSLYQFLKSAVIASFRSEHKFLLMVPVIGSFYYAIVMPICYDEGLTYLYFTSRSMLASMSYYPEPNNHILNSLLTNITYHLPFGDSEFRLRLPSLLVSLLTWIIAYKLLITYFNKQVALIVTGIGSMIFLVFYYSYQSRGYALVNLFFISAFYNALGIIYKKDSLNNWVWFGVCSILGFYTMPSFLYPFLTLNLLILIYNRPNIRRQFVTNAIVTMITVILYLPIVVVNGLNALTNNTYVKSIDRGEVIRKLPEFFSTSLNELTQSPWYFTVLALLPSLIYTLVKRQGFNISLFLLFLLSPWVLLAAHAVIPFPRTFNYYGFILPLLAVIGFTAPLEKISARWLLVGLLIAQLGLLYQFSRRIIPYEERDPQLNWSSKSYNNMMVGNKRYFSSGNLLGTTLLYELKTQGFDKAEVIFYNAPVNADTLQNFDYIIIGKQNDFTKNKKARITTQYYHIY